MDTQTANSQLVKLANHIITGALFAILIFISPESFAIESPSNAYSKYWGFVQTEKYRSAFQFFDESAKSELRTFTNFVTKMLGGPKRKVDQLSDFELFEGIMSDQTHDTHFIVSEKVYGDTAFLKVKVTQKGTVMGITVIMRNTSGSWLIHSPGAISGQWSE